VMESIGLGGEANAGRRLTVMRAIDKLDRLGVEGVQLLLGGGRKDDSGDFTKGAGLDEPKANLVISCLTASGADGKEKLQEVARHVAKYVRAYRPQGSSFLDKGIEELISVLLMCENAGFYQDRVMFDPSVVRGLEYYTGPVFEAELTFEVKDDDGRPVRFGSVGGGGRYDGLVARFRAEPVPATGFSIGVSRLLAALRAIKSPIVAATETTGPVVVLALDRDADSMANYQRLVASLRSAGIAAELYLGSGGMNAQLKYADRRRSRVAVIQGSTERGDGSNPQVTIRDLKLGAELAKSTKDRADYLELRQQAQFPAPEAELVERVREVLARR
jgi:histidyl-tRNA synthetase